MLSFTFELNKALCLYHNPTTMIKMSGKSLELEWNDEGKKSLISIFFGFVLEDLAKKFLFILGESLRSWSLFHAV